MLRIGAKCGHPIKKLKTYAYARPHKQSQIAAVLNFTKIRTVIAFAQIVEGLYATDLSYYQEY
jgi:hypothetical protein